MRTIKFSLFSDLHHYPGVFRSQTPEHLWQIQRRAEEEKVDFIIHCGDLTHAPHECQDFVGMYNDFHIPSYHCLGNHDTDGTPLEQTLRLYHMPDGHYYFDQNGFRMIVADPNYYFHGGEYIHYDMGNYYPYGPYRDFMPPDQIDWLKGAIEGAPGPCLIFSHESFEREGNGVQNRALVRQVIHEANQKRPGSVLLCANGHYHRNALTILDNVAYFDVNSASYDWLDNAHDLYPEEETRAIRLLNHTVCYNDPIHAVVTVSEDGGIEIKGMESSMLYGVRREDTPNPRCDADGRPVEPRVLSAKFRLIFD